MALNWAVGGPASAPLPLPLLGFFTPQCVPLSLNAYSDTLARRWRISMARIFLKSSGPKPSPFGAPDFTPVVATPHGIPFLERLALLTVDMPLPPTYYFPMATERLRIV